jgi:hypothetical protein
MYRLLTVAGGTTLYTDYAPMFGTDPGSWSDFFGDMETVAVALGFTLRQYVPGTYAARLDLAGSGLWTIGSTIRVNTRNATESEFRHGNLGTYSFAMWGSSSASDFVTVDVIGKKLFENEETIERYRVQSNEMGNNLTPSGGITPASTIPDLESAWSMNAGTLGSSGNPDVPLPRGWYGRWGSTLSTDAWSYIRKVTRIASSITTTGIAHGFTRHPMDKSQTGGSSLDAITATYQPEFFIHQHEPAFACPWPNARRSQLIGVRITPGGTAVNSSWYENTPTNSTYLNWTDAAARAFGTPFNQGDVDTMATGAKGIWLGSNDADGRNDSKAIGEVWGISNADDGAFAGVYGDAPRMNIGTLIEAFWDPRG